MSEPSFPLLNRGPEALVAALNRDDAKTVEQVRLLTRSELEDLADAARRLADLIRSVQAQMWPARYAESDVPASHRVVVAESDDGDLLYNPSTGSCVIPDQWTR